MDSDGDLVAYDPSVFEGGPSMLLIKKDNFVRFLQEHDYGVIWHIIGQKIVLGHMSAHLKNRKGSLDMHGIYRLVNNKVKGELNPQYFDGANQRS